MRHFFPHIPPEPLTNRISGLTGIIKCCLNQRNLLIHKIREPVLRYFRIIRKKFIEEDKVRTYLLYAVGEILLAVIGILIALQVNNWNEANKIDRMMSQALSEIREDPVRDTLRLKSMITLKLEEFEAQTRMVDALDPSNA